VFEQKKTKQDEQKIVSSSIESPEVGENDPLVIHPHIFNFNRLTRLRRAVGLFIVNRNARRSSWISLNDVTPSNKLPNYGNAAQERFTFYLKNNNLHAFVWVMEKVISGLSKNTWMPLNGLMK